MTISCLRTVSKQTLFSHFSRPKIKTQRSCSFVVSSSVMTYDKELAAAKKAASLAARLCQKVQKALLKSDVQSKNDKSPVTVADYGSQAVVSFALQSEFPSEPFSLVAEEDSIQLRKDGAQEMVERITKLVNDTLASDGSYKNSTLSTEDVLRAIDGGKTEGGSHGRHWVLDPIDGTKGFVRGDQYAIALALLDEGKVVLGVLACPNLPVASIAGDYQRSSDNEVGCLFFAEVGAGTYMQSLNNSLAVKVQVTDIENSEEASFFESYEAAHSQRDLSSLIAKKLGVKAPPVRIDSQVKYGALSRGDGAIYLRFPHKGYREKIWDHAAGSIVVTESMNMGAYTYIAPRLCTAMEAVGRGTTEDIKYVGRAPSAATATGFYQVHVKEQAELMQKAIQPEPIEAGGAVTDAAGYPLDFSKGKYLDLHVGIIVTNQKLMPALLKAVKESLEEQVSSL